MEELLNKEKALLKLNAEIDQKNRRLSVSSDSPSKSGRKSSLKGKLKRPKSHQLGSNGYKDFEVQFVMPEKKQGEEPHKFVWAASSKNENFEKPHVSQPSEPEKYETVIKDMQDTILGVKKNEEVENEEDCEEECIGNDNLQPNKVEQTNTRLQNIKIRALESALEKLRFEHNEVIQDRERLEKEFRIADEAKKKMEKSSQGTAAQLEKARGEIVDLRHKLSASEEDCLVIRKEMDEAKRSAKKNLSNKSSSDVRLNRALEDVAKLKGELSAAEREKKEAKESGKKSLEEVTLKSKFLEKQRNELLQGFKKQMELIDVLKRQKLHLEAANVLRYTEEEFMQTLDWKPETNGKIK